MYVQWLLDVWMLISLAICLHAFTLDQWVAWPMFHTDFLILFILVACVGVGI